MTDLDRTERNRRLIQLAHPVFRTALAQVLASMQAQGWRPRLQCVWRSPDEEAEAHAAGHSQVAWGFHNATTPDGHPDALAADVLDDDAPLQIRRAYVWALAKAAHRFGLETGITFGLPANMKQALRDALAAGDLAYGGPIGWDADHVQVAGISITEAKAGARPGAPSTTTVNV